MSNFHNINLPKYIEIFAVGSSKFYTSLAVSMSGREVRNSDNIAPTRHYTLKDCRVSKTQFESFNNFFQARAGRKFAFRLKDHFDYKTEKQIMFISDGITSKLQLKKTYMDEISPYVRIITKPVSNSIKLWKNDEIIQAKSVDANTGMVEFHEVFPKGEKIFSSFEFDIPVRFSSDDFQYSFDKDGSIIIDDVELIEVHE